MKDDLFYCKHCISSGRENVYTKGKSAFYPKKDDLVKHELTVDHKFALTAQLSKENDEMEKAACTAYSNVKEAIISAMKNVYYLCKEDIPKEKMHSLNEHCLMQVCL